MTTHENSTATTILAYTTSPELEVGTTGWVVYRRSSLYRDLPAPMLRFVTERPEGATGEDHQLLRTETDAWGTTVSHYLVSTFVTTSKVWEDDYERMWVMCELTTLDVEEGAL